MLKDIANIITLGLGLGAIVASLRNRHHINEVVAERKKREIFNNIYKDAATKAVAEENLHPKTKGIFTRYFLLDGQYSDAYWVHVRKFVENFPADVDITKAGNSVKEALVAYYAKILPKTEADIRHILELKQAIGLVLNEEELKRLK